MSFELSSYFTPSLHFQYFRFNKLLRACANFAQTHKSYEYKGTLKRKGHLEKVRSNVGRFVGKIENCSFGFSKRAFNTVDFL